MLASVNFESVSLLNEEQVNAKLQGFAMLGANVIKSALFSAAMSILKPDLLRDYSVAVGIIMYAVGLLNL